MPDEDSLVAVLAKGFEAIDTGFRSVHARFNKLEVTLRVEGRPDRGTAGRVYRAAGQYREDVAARLELGGNGGSMARAARKELTVRSLDERLTKVEGRLEALEGPRLEKVEQTVRVSVPMIAPWPTSGRLSPTSDKHSETMARFEKLLAMPFERIEGNQCRPSASIAYSSASPSSC
jgi:hypothetical protein